MGTVIATGPFGDGSGSSFNDQGFSSRGPITAVQVFAGAAVDAIQFQYGGAWGPKHGGSGGNHYSASFVEGEYIHQVTGEATMPSD